MMEVAADWGLTHVFGMVGHSNLAVADAIRVQAEQGRMRFIGVRHEGAAARLVGAFPLPLPPIASEGGHPVVRTVETERHEIAVQLL